MDSQQLNLTSLKSKQTNPMHCVTNHKLYAQFNTFMTFICTSEHDARRNVAYIQN